MKQILKEHLFPVLMLIIGAACAAFSIECFLIPNTILDGGVTGISMMINYTSGIALSILVVVINIPFFIIGFKAMGKRFLFKGVFSTVAFARCCQGIAGNLHPECQEPWLLPALLTVDMESVRKRECGSES